MSSQPVFHAAWVDVYRETKSTDERTFIPARMGDPPRFWREARNFPLIEPLSPKGLRHPRSHDDGRVFTGLYRGRLEDAGVDAISDALEAVALDYCKPIVLTDDASPARWLFAEWWHERTGVVVPQLIDFSTVPA
jgi:hypothetical protein